MQNSAPPSLSDLCPGGLRDFLFGGFSQRGAEFDEEKFLANRQPPMFLIAAIFQRQLKQHYRICDGDLVMGLVMSEIWNFNISRYFAKFGTDDSASLLSNSEARRNLLSGCNAYSISQTLGIPSETVRRKVRKLIQMGWIERGADGGLISTPRIEEVFSPELTVETVRYFVSAARQVLAMLDSPDALPT